MTSQALQMYWSWIEGSHGMRVELMDLLDEADLSFNPGGQNMSLGALCREIGEIEYSYLQSFKTFKQDFAYRNPEPGLDRSLARLKAWYQALDDEMKAVIAAFTDEDVKKQVERPGGFQAPLDMQLEIYLQALLIFFGKATIYLKALNKTLPPGFQEWIA